MGVDREDEVVVVEWIVRAVGVFWFVGGIATLRALATSRVLDAAIAAIQGGWSGREQARAALLGVGAVLTTASGAALAGLDRAAIGLMIVGALVQGLWLAVAARWFPPEDASDRRGRRQVVNAFGVWLVATGLMIWARASGHVVLTAQPAFEAVIAVASVIVVAVQAREILRGAEAWGRSGGVPQFSPFETEVDGEGASGDPGRDDASERPILGPRRWMVAPDMYGALMVDLDTDERHPVEALALPAALLRDLEDFEDAVVGALVPDEGEDAGWVLPESEVAALTARAKALARALGPHSIDGRATWRLPPTRGEAASPPV